MAKKNQAVWLGDFTQQFAQSLFDCLVQINRNISAEHKIKRAIRFPYGQIATRQLNHGHATSVKFQLSLSCGVQPWRGPRWNGRALRQRAGPTSLGDRQMIIAVIKRKNVYVLCCQTARKRGGGNRKRLRSGGATKTGHLNHLRAITFKNVLTQDFKRSAVAKQPRFRWRQMLMQIHGLLWLAL